MKSLATSIWESLSSWELLETPIIGDNTIANFAGLCVTLFAFLLVGKIVGFSLKQAANRLNLARAIERTTLSAASKAAPVIACAIGIQLSIHLIEFGSAEGLERVVKMLIGVLVTILIAIGVCFFVEVPASMMTKHASRTKSAMDDMLVPIVRKSLKVMIWLFALVQIAQVLSDQPISSIIAGLGIGGLAFALAAQDTLKQVFGAMMIFTDKPFNLGDRVVFGEHDGIIEEVGLRSTRLRRLDGHLVTIPNGEIASKAVHNPGKRPHIRRVFHITITYDTPPHKIREGKEIILKILKNHEGIDPKGELLPRCYFMDFNDASLGYMCLYWYHPAAWWDYCEFTERVNLQILEQFNKAGIDFAFPTQTLHLAGDPKRPLKLGINDVKGPIPDLPE